MIKFKQKRAFTLSEVFVAIVVIAIVGSVCIAFLKNRNDYSREYMYYSVYQNLVKAVDTIMEDPREVYTEYTTCGDSRRCVKLKNLTGVNLCNALKDKLNFISENGNCIGQLANGAEFVSNQYSIESIGAFETNVHEKLSDTTDTSSYLGDSKAYSLVVDIDGQGQGKDTLFYDIMPFYITDMGKVVPLYGNVGDGVRGYTSNDYDAAGNSALLSFDVVYTDTDSNKLKIIPNGHAVSFPVAACLAGYVSGTYCSGFKPSDYPSGVSQNTTCTANADCRIRLVKKLKWSK